MRDVRIDLETARRHLAALDDPSVAHIFLCVPEARDAPGRVRHVYGTLIDTLDRLEREQQIGCGVFVTVNAMAGRRRLKSEVTRIRALWVERDGPGPELPLAPSLIVETSPGKRHEYLLLDRDDPLDPAEAARINRTIAQRFGGDRQAVDIARVLRLAGTWHLKSVPHRVRIVTVSETRYAARILRAKFPTAEKSERAAASPMVGARNARYLSAAVDGVCAELARAVEGTRNQTLNRASFRLARLGLSLADIDAILRPVALSIGLSETETVATIRSGAVAGGREIDGGSERRG